MRRTAVLIVLLSACSAHVVEEDAGTPDASRPDSGELDASIPDAGRDDAGRDDAGMGDAGEPDAGTPAFTACIEAEDAVPAGAVDRWASTVVPAALRAGSVRFDFNLPEPRRISIWARVRAPSHSHNSLAALLDGQDAGVEATWDVPITGVLRWQRVTRRGPTGTFWRADEAAWPGLLSAGPHAVTLAGIESAVELDAICASEVEPDERFLSPPSHATVRQATGLLANGIADESVALQALLNAVQPGETLQLPPGRIRFTTGLRLTTSNVTLRGADAGTVLFADVPDASISDGLAVQGLAELAAVPLSADAPENAHQVSTSSGTFAVGDVVTVTSDDYGGPAPNVPWPFFRFRMAYARVTAVQGGVLTLDRPLLSAFLTANAARVAKFRGLTDVVLEGFTVEGPTPAGPDNNLIAVSRCARCFFIDLTLIHARQSGLELAYTLDAQVVRPHVRDVVDTGGGGHGYGVAVTRSQGAVVRDGAFGGILRHAVPISWGARETFVFRNEIDRTAVQPLDKIGSIDVHGEDDYANLIEANHIVQGDPGIILGGGGTTHGNDGPWNVIRGNVIEDTTEGVAVFKQTYDAVIEGNIITRPSRYGVRVESGSDQAYVWNNTITASGLAAVYSRDSDGLDVRGNGLDSRIAIAAQVVDGGLYQIIDNALDGGRVVHPDAGTVAANR